MPHFNSHIPKSSLPPSQRSNPIFQIPEITEFNYEAELDKALAAEDYERVHAVLDQAPNSYKRKPEFDLMRATTYTSLGRDDEALDLLLELEKKKQNYLPIYLPLALIFMEKEWPGSALKSAKQALKSHNLNPEGRAFLEVIVKEATRMITAEAEEAKLSFDKMHRATIQNEKAQLAFNKYNFSATIHFAKEASKIAPNWTPPQNNLAQALFFSGKMNEAISLTEVVLSRDPQNLFALEKMVIYLFGAEQTLRMHEFVTQFAALSDDLRADSIEIERLIFILALVQDTPTLWKLAQRFAEEDPNVFYNRTWHVLSVAAAREGNWSSALDLMEKIDEAEAQLSEKEFLEDLRNYVSQQKPTLDWMPPFYPSVDIYLIPPILTELETVINNSRDEISPSQQSSLDNLFKKYPFLFPVIKLAIWQPQLHDLCANILVNLKAFDGVEELTRFAFSQTGSLDVRMRVLNLLYQKDRYQAPKKVRLWDEAIQNWREMSTVFQKIGNVITKGKPETLMLIVQAESASSTQEAIRFFEKAIKLEPSFPISYFNLGVLYLNQGKIKEGLDLLNQSVAVDPGFMFGHASIALNQAVKGNELEAIQHLKIVDEAKIINSDTAVTANLAYFHLAVQRHDSHSARERFEIAEMVKPEHYLVESHRKMLLEFEEEEKRFSELFRRDQKITQATYKKLMQTSLTATTNLNTCLETYPKRLLVATADFLRTDRVGTKGELAAWLTGNLLNPAFLKETLRDDLTEVDRAALRWILENGGTCPWKDMTDKYGDDSLDMSLWLIQSPSGVVGRLRLAGLLFSGILDGEQVAFIPPNIRARLKTYLKV